MPDQRLEPWADEQLLQTTLNYRGAGDDANQSDTVRFLRGVARLVQKRLPYAEHQSQGAAVFLLGSTELVDGQTLDFEFQPMLDNGATPVEGCVWFVGPVVASGSCLRLPPTSDADLFQLVVAELKLGEVCAVIYSPTVDTTTLRFYPNGLQRPDSYQAIQIPTGTIGLDAVLAVIDKVHKEKLVTPNAQSQIAKLWHNAGQFRVSDSAELTIQMYLEVALMIAFPTCKPRIEQTQVTGRLDIEIEEPSRVSAGEVIRHVLLELKVLRSYGSTGNPVSDGETATWIEEGVDQAFSYREERGTRVSALCCFDMRKADIGAACFDHVREKAEKLKVSLRVWRLFASAKAYRRYLAARAIG